MKKRSRIVAILVGIALTCSCGSPEKKPEQQPAAPAAAAQPSSAPAQVEATTPPAPVQPSTPKAALQTSTRPAAVQPLTPPATVQPAPTPATVPPPTAPVTVQPSTPPAVSQPSAPPATIQAPVPPTVVLLTGNPMGAVKFPHAAHARLVGAGCDRCHHASKPEKPPASKYQNCQDCHTKVATAPMKTKAQAAFHDPMAKKGICIDCHLKENATGKKAPVKCLDCHRKENSGQD
jgi:hypothetical protein